jgi:hypothetical protein
MIKTFRYSGLLAAVITLAALPAFSQSTLQDYPTAITANEISGTIKPRNLGDSRLTTYYYALTGEQGDLFINLVTRNFNGDIDVFTQNGLRPVAKIVVYADYGDNETGRAIYLRKPERLILRVQGRSPNDEDATFRLKFAGSFLAMRPDEIAAAPELPKVSAAARSVERKETTVSASAARPDEDKPKVRSNDREIPAEVEPIASVGDPESKSPVVANTEKETISPKPFSPEADTKTAVKETAAPPPPRANNSRRQTRPPEEAIKQPDKVDDEKVSADVPAERAAEPENRAERTMGPPFRTLTGDRRRPTGVTPPEPKVDPLASVNLVVQMKDGGVIEKKMSEVSKFSVDKGILTIVLKDGTTSRYSIVNLAKVTIE